MNCKFSIPKEGKKAIWEITNQCNYLCKYCIFASNSQKSDKELSLQECKYVIDELSKNNFSTIKITGGEPFLRKDIIDIISYAKSKNIFVDVSTNASLISDITAKKLAESKINKIHVSLDGYNKNTQEYIRGNNTFDRTINGINNLIKNNLYVRIGTIIYKNNENNIEDIIKFVISLKVNEIIFSIMEPVGRMNGNNSEYKTKSNQELQECIEFLGLKYKDQIIINYNWKEIEANQLEFCPAGTKFIFIDNLGNISPCTWINDFKKKYNIKKNTLSEILESEEIKKFSRCRNCVYKN